MISINKKLEKLFFSYNPKEFMPIYDGSHMINKKSFVWYKVRRAGRLIGRDMAFRWGILRAEVCKCVRAADFLKQFEATLTSKE